MTITAVLIDAREPEWVKNLQYGGAPKIETLLEGGDVWVSTDDGNILVIERKTPMDFLGTLGQDRLFLQAAKLQELRNQGHWCYVVITGELRRNTEGKVITPEKVTNWDWNSVQGAILNLQELGIFVHFCANDFDFEPCIQRLVNRSRSDAMRILPLKRAELLGKQASILCSLPGIGPEKVNQVLDFCGTAAAAIAELTNEKSTIRIPGVGKGVKNNVRYALGLKEGQLLYLMDKDLYEELGG